MKEYSRDFRGRMVQRMSGPKSVSAHALSKEVGIGQPTLSRWLREAATISTMAKRKTKAVAPKSTGPAPRRPSDWPMEEKMRVVLESVGLSESELGSTLRREGLHDEDLVRFRDEVRGAALSGASSAKKARSGPTDDQKKIKALERELRRKEAALAEAAALLVLRKKLNALWGEEGEDT
jgi:transposase-like protein